MAGGLRMRCLLALEGARKPSGPGWKVLRLDPSEKEGASCIE